MRPQRRQHSPKPLPTACLFMSAGAVIGFMVGSFTMAMGFEIGGFMAGLTAWYGPVVLFAIAFTATFVATNICAPCGPTVYRTYTGTSTDDTFGAEENASPEMPGGGVEEVRYDYTGYDNVVCFLSVEAAAAATIGWVIGALLARSIMDLYQ